MSALVIHERPLISAQSLYDYSPFTQVDIVLFVRQKKELEPFCHRCLNSEEKVLKFFKGIFFYAN